MLGQGKKTDDVRRSRWNARLATFDWLGIIVSVFHLLFTLVGFVAAVVVVLQAFHVTSDMGETGSISLEMIATAFLFAITANLILTALIFIFNARTMHQKNKLQIEYELLSNQSTYNNVRARDLQYVINIFEYLIFYLDRIQTLYPSGHKNRDDWDRKFLQSLVNNTRNIFERLTHQECSVCIKQYLSAPLPKDVKEFLSEIDGPGTKFVKTYIRDRLSAENRAGLNDRKYYSVENNTAFAQIISKNAGNNYYINNDLKSSKYKNSNRHWPKYYNATVVVPIKTVQYSNKDDNEYNEITIGFLCVDSKRAIFEEDSSVRVLQMLARTAGFVLPVAKLNSSKSKNSSSVRQLSGGDEDA